MAPKRKRLSFDELTETEFEGFCFDLLGELGFVNVDWRKGTGLKSSPADRGRDIVAQLRRTDVDRSEHLETWFVDAKRYLKGVPAEKLQSALAWSEAKSPSVLLFIISNFLSNSAKDFLEEYRRTRVPKFRIKVWEKPQLLKLTSKKRFLLDQYGLLPDSRRSQTQILKAEQEMYDRRWYDRHQMWVHAVKAGKDKPDSDTWKSAEASARQIEKKYGKKNLGPYSDFKWGELFGRHATLRWVLGDDWNNGDT